MSNRTLLWTLVLLLLILGVSLNLFVYLGTDLDDGVRNSPGNGEVTSLISQDSVLLTRSRDRFFVEEIPFPVSDDYPVLPEGPGFSSDVVSSDAETVPGGTPLFAILMDDFGYSLSLAREARTLSLPLTWSIIPGLSNSSQIAEMARLESIPFLVHLPMQAFVDDIGGPYLVGEGMTYGDIRQQVRETMAVFPAADGMNNHRGSKATSDSFIMGAVMDEFAQTGKVFIDSRTSSTSVAYETALEKGIPALYNSLFLDNSDEEEEIGQMFLRAREIACRKGWVLAICHLRPSTLSFLEKLCINDHNEVEFVTVPELFKALGAE